MTPYVDVDLPVPVGAMYRMPLPSFVTTAPWIEWTPYSTASLRPTAPRTQLLSWP